MKTITLGWHGHPITVSDEGYAALMSLVAQHRVCGQCGSFYETEQLVANPMVAENICLSCIMQAHQNLTFVGPLGEPDGEGYQRFTFLDVKGYVHLSCTRFGDEPKLDTYQTLVHWGFPLPSVYTPPRGEEVKLYSHSWHVYGDVMRASVVVIERSYDDKHTCVFLSYKHEEYHELTKRDGDMKRLLEQARAIVEESKDESGWYQLGDYPTKYIRDSVVYQIVSQIASAVNDVKRRLSQSIAEAKQAATSEAATS